MFQYWFFFGRANMGLQLLILCCLFFFKFQVLLPAASLLQLMDVRQNCCDFLQSQLHPTNCLGIRAFADVHTCTELLQQANAYAGDCNSPQDVPGFKI